MTTLFISQMQIFSLPIGIATESKLIEGCLGNLMGNETRANLPHGIMQISQYVDPSAFSDLSQIILIWHRLLWTFYGAFNPSKYLEKWKPSKHINKQARGLPPIPLFHPLTSKQTENVWVEMIIFHPLGFFFRPLNFLVRFCMGKRMRKSCCEKIMVFLPTDGAALPAWHHHLSAKPH